MAICGQMIEGRVVSFSCDLDSGHDGPHRAYENSRSVRERTKWESQQKVERARADLDQFQGPAQTTAERYTENPTPVPGRRPTPEPDVAEHIAEQVRKAAEEEVEASVAAPTKTREGDQPLPRPTQGEYVQDRIIAKINALRGKGTMTDEQADILIAQMEGSKQVGIQRYGSALQAFNGRDTLQDAAEEARDLYVYLNSLIQAREVERVDLVEVVAKAFHPQPDGEDYATAQIAVDAILKATGGFGT